MKDQTSAPTAFDIEGTRRAFLGPAFCAVIAALAECCISAEAALSFPIVATSPEVEQGAERSYSLPSADVVSIDQANGVILARFANHVYAFSLACPHQNAALRWMLQDRRFQCPRHLARYQPDGTWMNGRRTRNMDRLGLRLDGERIIGELSKLLRADSDATAWDAAVIVLG